MTKAIKVSFHPEALNEYANIADRYVEEAGAVIAARFVTEIETGVVAIRESPTMWRVVDPPDIRRYLTHHFPYAIYYRWQSESEQAIIYAVMHTSRRPGYWQFRT